MDEIPVKCPRKKVAPRKQIKDALNTGIQVKKLEVDDYYGFEIDGNRRFVLGDFTVTHNTVIGINIASRLRKKTLIIVHKDFLLNQWIERIEQFMPGARVGRIQGPTIDVADKDIVIAMLQSISMKHYDPALFDCFGFTIIDEVHHMGAEVFSQALQKVVTPYVLGLSATMARKDGLTNVFKMFMGDIVHTEKRDTSAATVRVRAYAYQNDDEEFSEMKFDYRGNPLYSTMIKKLCECDDRSEYLLDIVQSNLEEFPELQMMVMAHNKSLLKYLYEGALERGIAGGSVWVLSGRDEDGEAEGERGLSVDSGHVRDGVGGAGHQVAGCAGDGHAQERRYPDDGADSAHDGGAEAHCGCGGPARHLPEPAR